MNNKAWSLPSRCSKPRGWDRCKDKSHRTVYKCSSPVNSCHPSLLVLTPETQGILDSTSCVRQLLATAIRYHHWHRRRSNFCSHSILWLFKPCWVPSLSMWDDPGTLLLQTHQPFLLCFCLVSVLIKRGVNSKCLCVICPVSPHCPKQLLHYSPLPVYIFSLSPMK